MSINLTNLISDVRIELNDTASSHFQRNEIPQGTINGSNKVFYLAYYPLISNVVGVACVLTVDGTVITTYTIDSAKGVLTLTTAPATSISADYYFYIFSDTEINSFIQSAVESCGFTLLSQVPDTMITAIKIFAYHFGCLSFSRRWAEGFSWTVGPETVDKKGIAKNYIDLAAAAWDKGIAMRDDYYIRFGARNAPSGDILQFHIPRYDVIR